MGKAAWTAMISYQLFVQTAVATVADSIFKFWPSTTTAWLASRSDMMSFIHAYAWVFVLTSVMPSVLLKKRNSVLTQFLACLTLTIVPIWVRDNLHYYTDSQAVDRILNMSGLFNDPLYATTFLLAPYIFMISLDIYTRVKDRREEEWIQKQRLIM